MSTASNFPSGTPFRFVIKDSNGNVDYVAPAKPEANIVSCGSKDWNPSLYIVDSEIYGKIVTPHAIKEAQEIFEYALQEGNELSASFYLLKPGFQNKEGFEDLELFNWESSDIEDGDIDKYDKLSFEFFVLEETDSFKYRPIDKEVIEFHGMAKEELGLNR